MSPPQNFPFFTLVNDQSQAEAALAAIECFAERTERLYFKPKVSQIKRDFFNADKEICLAHRVNTLIADYIENIGELSDQLMIFISKSLLHNK